MRNTCLGILLIFFFYHLFSLFSYRSYRRKRQSFPAALSVELSAAEGKKKNNNKNRLGPRTRQTPLLVPPGDRDNVYGVNQDGYNNDNNMPPPRRIVYITIVRT